MTALASLLARGATVIPDLALQGTVGCLVALVLERAARGRLSSSARQGLWLSAALAFVVPVSACLSSVGSAPPSVRGALGLAPAAPVAATSAVGPAALLAVWAVGAAVAAGLALASGARFRARVRSGRRRAPPGLSASVARAASCARLARPPEVVVTTAVSVPGVAGLLRPVLLWPAGVPVPAGRAPDPVLVHECAHLARRDLWVEAAMRALAVLWWVHPLAWVVLRRARAAREAGCDATAVVRLGDPAGYRLALLRSAARAHGLLDAAPAAFVRSRSEVLARLHALERPVRPRPALTALAAATGLVAAAAVAGGSVPATSLCDDPLALARAAFARRCADADRVGCFELRFAAMKVAALEAARR